MPKTANTRGDPIFYIKKRLKQEFLDACECITVGSLRIWTPEGAAHDFGQGEPRAEVTINDWAMISALAARGNIGLGEAYVAGLWDTPSIEDVISLASKNIDRFGTYAHPSWFNAFRYRLINRLLRPNSLKGAAKNIRSHYDVGNEFYQLWLDEGMTYSSALFDADDDDLSRAQLRKYDRVLSRLNSGDRILELGCGWGGFAERAADDGRHVTGLTLSRSQKGYADARLDGRADIHLLDYRAANGQFDHIVSIEMIETVGEKFLPAYFKTMKSRLAENGSAVIQAITVPDDNYSSYRQQSDFIRQYTFPGGMLLSDATISNQARNAGLVIRDRFAFGEHYARTCRIWAARMEAQVERIKSLGFDSAFLRTWQYHLGLCAASFATGRTDVVQIELAHA